MISLSYKHVFLSTNKFIIVGLDPKQIMLPREFILNWNLLTQFYPFLLRE